jgi:hypothetical protein
VPLNTVSLGCCKFIRCKFIRCKFIRY